MDKVLRLKASGDFIQFGEAGGHAGNLSAFHGTGLQVH